MKQLVCYLTAAFPSLSFSADLIAAMSESGVDIIELGIPFSDPVADGEVIAKANAKALHSGFVFDNIAQLAEKISPIVRVFVMSYANPLYHNNLDSVFANFAKSGISGVIIPDVPFEESAPYQQIAAKHHLSLVPFVAPTTPKQRVQTLVATADASAFIYLVAYAGITGAAKNEDLHPLIAEVRKHTTAPLFVGFGVNAQNAHQKAKDVDGVIVGSAIVSILLEEGSYAEKIRKICAICKTIKEAINL